jgi:hypothetical protein
LPILSLHAYPGQPSPGFTTFLRPPCFPLLKWVGARVSPKSTQPRLATLRLEWARSRWYRNINRLCIDYACRPRLSSRLTLGRLALTQEPLVIRRRGFSPLFRYSCLHSHSCGLHGWITPPLHCHTTLPYPSTRLDRDSKCQCHSFGGVLEPRYIVRAGITRPVSYYALFKGWLLLSQPPGCQCNSTSFPT